MDMKRCSACGNEFPATPEFFYRERHNKDGLRKQCKTCREKSKQPVEESTSARQDRNHTQTITLEVLSEKRERYVIDAPFQREDSWSLPRKQALIDSILRGMSIPSPTAYMDTNEKGGLVYVFLDGHHRVNAILEFMDNKFKTFSYVQKQRYEPSSVSPAAPARFYEDLPQGVKDNLLQYQLVANITPKGSPAEMATLYARLNSQQPLSPGERAKMYPSQANVVAKVIEKHTTWEDFYIGARKRQEAFQGGLYLLAIELNNGFVDLRTKTYVPPLASGKYDEQITDDLLTTVLGRLDAVACVFSGMQVTEKVAFVAMYQAVMLVEQAGGTIQSISHRGTLTSWLASEIDSSKHASGLPIYHRPIQQLLLKKGQEAFWARCWKTVATRFGIHEPAA